jgi:hypothetical protein
VTSSFGGVVRDVLTKKESLTVGHESFAFTTGAGAAVYVGLRQLMLFGPDALGAPWLERALRPLTVRIGLCVGTVLGIRAYAWTLRPDPLLYPMFALRPPPPADADAPWRWPTWAAPHTLGGRLATGGQRRGGDDDGAVQGPSKIDFER